MKTFPKVTDWTVEVSVKAKDGAEVLSTATLRYERDFYRGKVSYPKTGAYTLSYTLKDAQGNAIQPKNNDGVDTTLGTEIQF